MAERTVRARIGFGRFGWRAFGCECVIGAISEPVGLFHRQASLLGIRASSSRQLTIANCVCHLRKAARCLDPEALHVELFVWRIKSAALNPPCAKVFAR